MNDTMCTSSWRHLPTSLMIAATMTKLLQGDQFRILETITNDVAEIDFDEIYVLH
jgi:hypothetical protein